MLTVPDVPGPFSQVRDLDEALAAAADAITLLLDLDEAPVLELVVDVDERPTGPA